MLNVCRVSTFIHKLNNKTNGDFNAVENCCSNGIIKQAMLNRKEKLVNV